MLAPLRASSGLRGIGRIGDGQHNFAGSLPLPRRDSMGRRPITHLLVRIHRPPGHNACQYSQKTDLMWF